MPVTGAKAKPRGQSITRHPPVHDWSEIVDVPFKGPRLPPRPGGGTWSARSRRWWVATTSMPHCVLWSPSDWDFAETTLLVAAEVHEGVWRAATELRNREKVMGTTVDYRRDLRIRYVPAAQGEAAAAPVEVTRLDDYRDL